MLRPHVVKAVMKRNFASYFSGVLGYLFIVVFCVASAVLAFDDTFFSNNQANLDQLSARFPWLLLFLIPAITMSCWSDEKKLGTDELLFTLPATEGEILLGKYLSVLGVYTVTLLFSLVNPLVLSFLGSPDAGLIFSSYAGYWLSGAALLSIGMLASSLTSSATVAFVLGVVFCCIPVLLGSIPRFLEEVFGLTGGGSDLTLLDETLSPLSLSDQLVDFSTGVIPLRNVLYFAFLTTLALYLNFVVISRRRWQAASFSMGTQYTVRFLCLMVTAVSLLYLVGRMSFLPVRADMTAERLYTLSEATEKVLEEIRSGTPVEVQAFYSPDVPKEFAEKKRQLLGLLREFRAEAGDNLVVREVEVQPFSKEAEEARAMGVNPVRVQFEDSGRLEDAEVFLGVAVHSPTDDIVLPFFDRGLPVEYELTRSLATVLQDQRKTIGVLRTDASVMSEQSSFGGGRDWEIVRELQKQFDVKLVDPSQPLIPVESAAGEDAGDDVEDGSDPEEEAEVETQSGEPDFDVLLAVSPSSLTTEEMGNFLDYVRSGRPTLIFDDPLTLGAGFTDMTGAVVQAPVLSKPNNSNPMMGGQSPPPPPKADEGRLTQLLKLLDIGWRNNRIVYDRTRPHSEFSNFPEEVVFLSRSQASVPPFNPEHPVTKNLQDAVVIFSGSVGEVVRDEEDRWTQFTPLLQTSENSGRLRVESAGDAEDSALDVIAGQGFSRMTFQPTLQLRSNPIRRDDENSHILAAHIEGTTEERPLNVIFVSDIDMIGDQFFQIRTSGTLDVQFDNVTFVLNAVDTLAGEESITELRSRRETRRTLTYVEGLTRDLQKKLAGEETAAEEAKDKRLEEAQEELDEKVAEIENSVADERSKRVQIEQKREELQRKLEIQEAELELEKNRRVRKAAIEMKREVRRIENVVRVTTWFLPAILPISFGMLILGIRAGRESQTVSGDRRR